MSRKEQFELWELELDDLGRGLFTLTDRKEGNSHVPVPFTETEIREIAACKDKAAGRQRFYEISLTPLI